MRLRAFVFAAFLVASVACAQATQPPTHHKRFTPPEPRDGEGTVSTICPILIYHSIRPYVESDTAAVRRFIATPQALDEEFAWLRANNYTPISFDDLANHINTGASLPPKPVILSFDDDWESQYRYALPLLKQYGFTATFYIWVSVVGIKNHMTWDQIRDLKLQGMQLGAHSITHPYLTRIQNDDMLRHEILASKQVIESRTGATVTSFAYPFGQYDERVVDAVKAAGFTSARSTWPGVVHSREGLFSLTGLLRTESEESLVDGMQKYLVASESADGVAGAASAEESTAPSAASGISGVAGAGTIATPSP